MNTSKIACETLVQFMMANDEEAIKKYSIFACHRRLLERREYEYNDASSRQLQNRCKF